MPSLLRYCRRSGLSTDIKMPNLIANLLTKIACPDDAILLKACLQSIIPVCEHIYILDGTDNSNAIAQLIEVIQMDYCYTNIHVIRDTTTIEKEGYAAARNILLDKVAVGDYVLWVDSDEVHFTEGLKQLKNTVLGQYDDVNMHFVHFTLGSNGYEKFEARTTIFRKEAESTWVGKVHEHIMHHPYKLPRKLFYSDYIYHHYGYIRNQELIYNKWRQYCDLEGTDKRRIEQEYPDHRVLDHRKNSLIPYFGEYPSTIPSDWILGKMVNL